LVWGDIYSIAIALAFMNYCHGHHTDIVFIDYFLWQAADAIGNYGNFLHGTTLPKAYMGTLPYEVLACQ
jgi:hypothetical protein